MKTRMLLLLSMAMLSAGLAGQKVFKVQYDSQADVKIFAVNYESQCDLKVFFVDYASQADEDGLWYWVDYESQADVKVYFVDADYKAKWNKPSKIHLLY